MAKSKTTQKKTATKQAPKANPVASVAVPQQPSKHKPSAVRRVPVQYTPRIPLARCPGC